MQFMKIGVADITCRNEKRVFSQKTGELTGKVRRLSAEFERGVPGWAVEFALKTWPLAMQNKPDTLPIELYFSWFDSKRGQERFGWSDEEREIVEQRLSKKVGVVLVEEPRLPAPYPKYDLHRKLKGQRTVDHAIKDIVATFDAAGFSVGAAVAYERQNLNDAEVIAALENLEEPVVVEEEMVAK